MILKYIKKKAYDIIKKCEHPNVRLTEILLNGVFSFVMIYFGKLIYILNRKKDKRIILMPSRSNGDILIFIGFIEAFYEKNKCTKNDSVIWASSCTKRVFDSLNIEKVKYFSTLSIAALMMAYVSLGRKRINIINAYKWLFFDYKELTLKVNFKYPEFEVDLSLLNNRFKSIGVVDGKSVLISPYEKSITAEGELIPPSFFWENIVNKLSDRGYLVFTNCNKPKGEKAIEGTQVLFPRFNECEKIAEKMGHVISLRSGFTDFIRMAKANIVVLYPSNKYLDKYSLYNITDNNYIEEMVYESNNEDEAYWARFADEVVGIVLRGK